MGYTPSPQSASALHISLGWVNSYASVGGTDLTVQFGAGAQLLASDVGSPVQLIFASSVAISSPLVGPPLASSAITSIYASDSQYMGPHPYGTLLYTRLTIVVASTAGFAPGDWVNVAGNTLVSSGNYLLASVDSPTMMKAYYSSVPYASGTGGTCTNLGGASGSGSGGSSVTTVRAPLWTTITAVTDQSHGTIADSVTGTYSGVQAIIYREVIDILSGTRTFQSSLTTRSTLNFTTRSDDGSFIPATGQPVLMTEDGFGDVFGGSIDQAQASNEPGNDAVQTECQCVSWDQVLTRRLIILAGYGTNAFASDSFTGDGTTRSWQLKETPTKIVNVQLNGADQTFGPAGTGGVAFLWWPGSTWIFAVGGPITTGATLTISYLANASSENNLSYSNTTAGAVVEALGALIANEGLTVEAVIGPSITQITFTDQDTIDSALSQLLTYINNGTAAYWYYVDARKVLHFDLVGTTTAPWNVEVGDGSAGNALIQISRLVTREKFSNGAWTDLTIATVTPLMESFPAVSGTSATTSVTLSFPLSATPTIVLAVTIPPMPSAPSTVSYISQTVGVTGTSGKDWYWTPGSATITRDPLYSGTVTSLMLIEVTYTPSISAQDSYVDLISTAARAAIEGGSGEYDAYVDLGQTVPITSGPVNFVGGGMGGSAVVSGTTSAKTLVAYYEAMSEEVQLVTYRAGLVTGQTITVDLPQIRASGTYYVDAVTLTDVGNMALWTFKLVAGAVIGDWKTSLKNLSGAGGGGGGSFAGGIGGSTMRTWDAPPQNSSPLPVGWLSNRTNEPVGYSAVRLKGYVSVWSSTGSPSGTATFQVWKTKDGGLTYLLVAQVVVLEGDSSDQTANISPSVSVIAGEGLRLKLATGSVVSAVAFHWELIGG